MIRKALTIGEIASRTNSPVHRVEYFIRSRKIKPIERAGNLRVFSETDFMRIRDELNLARTHLLKNRTGGRTRN